MISIPDKAKQFLIAVVKLLIVGGAFYFIYTQLAENDKLDWQRFEAQFRNKWSIGGIAFILFLSFANRFIEILKWRNLVSSFRKISLATATKHVLAALTASIFTPNGIGEYAGKALYFDKSETKNIIFLNLINNGVQMILSVLFGIFGLLYFNAKFEIITTTIIAICFIALFAVLIFAFAFKHIKIKGYSIERMVHAVNEIPKSIHQKNMLFGLARYLVFSHQSYFLFRAFGVDLPYFLIMSVICSTYFLASSLPTFQFLDFAVKGSVAVFFFGILGVNEWIVIFITTLTWFLNVVLPVAIGSYYVLSFKANKAV